MKSTLLTLLLIMCLPSFAQRRNSQGYKMVSHVAIKHVPATEDLLPYCRDVYYHYDENNKLIGIDDHVEEGVVVKYRKKEEYRVVGRTYYDGRLVPGDSIVLNLNSYYERIHDHHIGEDRFHIQENDTHRRDVITVVKKANMTMVQKEEYWIVNEHPNNKEEMKQIVEEDINKIDFNNRRARISPDLPFAEEAVYYFSRDGYMYSRRPIDPSCIRMYCFIDGDMQNNIMEVRPASLISRQDDVFNYNEYTDIKNDTNVEFYGLTCGEGDGWYFTPEYSSEWLEEKSMHLPKYIDIDYKNGRKYMKDMQQNDPERYAKKYGNMRLDCDSEWSYEFDDKNNLVKIHVIRHTGFYRDDCCLTIEYVQ